MPAEKPKLSVSPVQVAGAVLATLTVTVLTSFLGTAGTVTGAVASTLICTAGASLYAHGIRLTSHGLRKIHHRKVTASPLILAAGGAGLLAVVFGGIAGVEAVTGRPVSASLTGSHRTGSTFGGSQPQPSAATQEPAATYSPEPSAPASRIPPSAAPALTPALAPVPSPSASPAATAPSPSPSALPSSAPVASPS